MWCIRIIIILIFINSIIKSQDISIQITNSQNKAALLKLSGENVTEVDSISWLVGGIYKFSSDNLNVGFYRLKIDKHKYYKQT